MNNTEIFPDCCVTKVDDKKPQFDDQLQCGGGAPCKYLLWSSLSCYVVLITCRLEITSLSFLCTQRCNDCAILWYFVK